MIKIGEFARLSQVSVVALRHYDEIGLLNPIAVDASTGYRYYSVSQLPRLNRILALKDLGFSLDQIDQVLNGLTLEQLRGMLKLKQAEVERLVAEEQSRLTRITARLTQIELEDTMPNYDVVLKTIPPTLICSRTVTVPTNGEVPTYLGSAFREASTHIHQHGAKETGVCFTIWHQPADVYVNEEVEAAFPIDHPVGSTDRVKVYEQPEMQVVSVIHQGSFAGFPQAHAALLTWAETNGYKLAGTYREIYINDNHTNVEETTTEIQYPVAKS